jgi:hypothetical protein
MLLIVVIIAAPVLESFGILLSTYPIMTKGCFAQNSYGLDFSAYYNEVHARRIREYGPKALGKPTCNRTCASSGGQAPL